MDGRMASVRVAASVKNGVRTMGVVGGRFEVPVGIQEATPSESGGKGGASHAIAFVKPERNVNNARVGDRILADGVAYVVLATEGGIKPRQRGQRQATICWVRRA